MKVCFAEHRPRTCDPSPMKQFEVMLQYRSPISNPTGIGTKSSSMTHHNPQSSSHHLGVSKPQSTVLQTPFPSLQPVTRSQNPGRCSVNAWINLPRGHYPTTPSKRSNTLDLKVSTPAAYIPTAMNLGTKYPSESPQHHSVLGQWTTA